MCRNLVVGEALQGLAQQRLGLAEIAQPEVDPAKTVENRRIIRVELVGLLDQLQCFLMAEESENRRTAEDICKAARAVSRWNPGSDLRTLMESSCPSREVAWARSLSTWSRSASTLWECFRWVLADAAKRLLR